MAKATSKDPAGAKSERYHHGDLRQALLAAAEMELQERGVEGFTLRGCAKRAGVSHAAPAHHFKDANALLTALAAEGFSRFIETMRKRQVTEGRDPTDQLIAAGMGYIDFATTNPALFRLMFSSDRPDRNDPELAVVGHASFEALVSAVARIPRSPARNTKQTIGDVAAAWAVVHGTANLLLSGRLPMPEGLTASGRDDFVRGIVARIVS